MQICYDLAVGNIDYDGNRTGNEDLSDPKYSPINGDFSNVCDIYWICGIHENFFDDCQIAANNAIKAGVEVICDWNEYTPHTAAFVNIEECKFAIYGVCTWINKKTGYKQNLLDSVKKK